LIEIFHPNLTNETYRVSLWPKTSKESKLHPVYFPCLLLKRGTRRNLRVSKRCGKVHAQNGVIWICKGLTKLWTQRLFAASRNNVAKQILMRGLKTHEVSCDHTLRSDCAGTDGARALPSEYESTVCVQCSRVRERKVKGGTTLQGADSEALTAGLGLVPLICEIVGARAAPSKHSMEDLMSLRSNGEQNRGSPYTNIVRMRPMCWRGQ